MGNSFDITRSWILSFDFFPPDFANEQGQTFFWGDDRPGLDPIFVRQRGAILEACLSNCQNNSIEFKPT